MYEALHRCVQVFASGNQYALTVSHATKMFRQGRNTLQGAVCKMHAGAENCNKNAPSSLQNSNVSLTGKIFGNTNKVGSVSKQGFVKREFYCRNKLILFVVEVFPSAINTASQRQFCTKTASVMYFLCIVNAVLCSYLLRVLFCMSSRSRFSAVAEQYKNSIQKTKRSK